MPTKPNRAGNQQNYVPAGNGDASGEYGDNATGSNIHITIKDNGKAETKSTTVKKGEKQVGEHKKRIGEYIKSHSAFNEKKINMLQRMIDDGDAEINGILANTLEKGNYSFDTGRTSYCNKWGIVLAPSDLNSPSRVQGETLYHELGHLVDGSERDRFQNVVDLTGKTYSGGFISEKYNTTLQDMITQEGQVFAKSENIAKIKEIKAKYQQEELSKTGLYNEKQIEQIINQHDKYREEKQNALDEDYRNSDDLYGKLWNEEITKEQYNIERAKQKIVLDTKLKTIESKYKSSEEEYYKYLREKGIANVKASNRFYKEYSSISDIYDGATNGAANFGAGHSKRYWRESPYHRGNEFFAEAFSARATNKQQYETMKEYFPKSIEIFEEILKEIQK